MKKTLLLAGVLVSAAAANAQISIMASNTAFLDISGTGTSLGTATDDSELVITGASLAAFAGNGLLAGGVSVRVGNNGCIVWGNSASDTFLNADQVGYINASPFGTTPNPFLTMAASNLSTTGNGGSGPRQFLAALWDDMTPTSGGGATTQYWQIVGNDLYIMWRNEDHFNATGTGTVTFEAIIRGGVSIASGNALVEYVYDDTFYGAGAFQNDGGSATIGYKNWGVNASANDVEWGTGGGTNAISDPTSLTDPSYQPKVGGWTVANDLTLTHAVKIVGPVPEPGTMAALGLGALALIRKRRAK